MECIWRQYTNVGSHRQPSNYHDFHCDSLFIAVMEDVEAVLEGVAGEANGRNGEWLQSLSDAWRMFLSDAPNRAVWEKSKLAALVGMQADRTLRGASVCVSGTFTKKEIRYELLDAPLAEQMDAALSCYGWPSWPIPRCSEFCN
jgi:hypothetical protein